VWFFANNDTQNYRSPGAFMLAAVNRVAYFAFVAIGGTAMRQQREEMRARMEALMRTRELEQEIVRVGEREQMRIGQDLHDGLCQSLVAIDCAAECLRADLEARAVPEAKAAGGIQRMLKDAVIEARNIARGVFPVQMDSAGLPVALQELADRTSRLRQIPSSLTVSGDVRVDDPQTAMHLYRIAQQALNNALQHSSASQIVIGLTREGRTLNMTVSDNGWGFDEKKAPSRGMGLQTMRYRARQIGAELEVNARPGRGTQIRCTLPLPHANHT
jgi:signal transduction histidine kinase